MSYEKIKESRKITRLIDLPINIQNDIKDFIHFYDPYYIELHGSFAQGSWIDNLDSDFAKIRSKHGKPIRISDCDISVNHNCTKINKYKSLDIVPYNGGLRLYCK